jgi:methyl coenzyme M reductase gamma subunit
MNHPNQHDMRTSKFEVIFPLVTHQMLRFRTVELAINAGRRSIEIRQRDYEQAKRELTGETDFERQQAVLYPV